MRKRTLVTALSALAFSLGSCGLASGAKQGSSDGGAADNIAAQIAAVTDEQLQGTSIKLARFFGDCDDTAAHQTDISKATTECEAIQILTNKFVAENKWGIKVY